MNARKRSVPRLSAAELEILQMLWHAGGVTILEAQQALGLPIGYTTVQTRLNRLTKKGVVNRSKERPAKYSAAITQNDVRGGDLDLLVTKVSNGQVTPLVAHLISRKSISKEEFAELRKLIDEAEKRLRRNPRRSS